MKTHLNQTRTSNQLIGKTLLGSYDTYEEAQRIVDSLSDQKFAVENTAIVARDLAVVESVTGRLNWGRALLNGLLSGASTGFLIGAILGLFVINGLAWMNLLLYSTAIGSVIGGVFGLIGYALSGGKRDFTSVGGVQAGSYEVYVADEMVDEARRMTGRQWGTAA